MKTWYTVTMIWPSGNTYTSRVYEQPALVDCFLVASRRLGELGRPTPRQLLVTTYYQEPDEERRRREEWEASVAETER